MDITRRRFLKSLLFTAGSLAVAGCGTSAIKSAADKLSSLGTLDSSIEFPRQLVAADNSTGRTIMWQTKPGAFTGDVSAQMVLDLGATWTLVGHSERRTYHHETNQVVRLFRQDIIISQTSKSVKVCPRTLSIARLMSFSTL